jgi:hypothetical protein
VNKQCEVDLVEVVVLVLVLMVIRVNLALMRLEVRLVVLGFQAVILAHFRLVMVLLVNLGIRVNLDSNWVILGNQVNLDMWVKLCSKAFRIQSPLLC